MMKKYRHLTLIVVALSLLVALLSYRFAILGFSLSFPDMPQHLLQRRVAFILHVSFSPIALALGAVQFLPKLRAKGVSLHRWLGGAYTLSVVVGAGTGLRVALGAAGGVAVSFGFGLLSVIWIAVTLNAVRLAMIGKIARHHRWMFRSFALTFAAVTLRVYLLGFAISGVAYTEASVYLAWVCWIPNVIFAEWYLRRR